MQGELRTAKEEHGVLARKKVKPKVIQDLMEHSSAGMTMSYIHYTHQEYIDSVGFLE